MVRRLLFPLLLVAAAGGDLSAPDPRSVETDAALDRTVVSFELEDRPVDEALEDVARLAGVCLEHRARAEGPATLCVTDVPARDALELLTRLAGRSWRIERGVVVVDLPDEREPILELFDVSAITAPDPDPWGLVPVPPTPPHAFEVERLVELVGGVGALRTEVLGYRGDVLIVVAPPRTQRRIARLLEMLEAPLARRLFRNSVGRYVLATLAWTSSS